MPTFLAKTLQQRASEKQTTNLCLPDRLSIFSSEKAIIEQAITPGISEKRLTVTL